MELAVDENGIERLGRRLQIQNAILRSISDESLSLLVSQMDLVKLEPRQVLSAAGAIPEFVYFLEGGVISFTMELPVTGAVDFGVIGREGISSFTALRSERVQPVSSTVQVGGYTAYRIAAERLRHVLKRCPDILDAIFDTLYLLMGQMAFTAASNSRHSLAARTARWLLLCDDRLDGDDIPLTHESLARVLSSQRTSVTSVLHILEGENAIRSRRGVISITNRDRLERVAGEAYIG